MFEYYYYHAGKTWDVTKLWEATKNNPILDIAIETFIKYDNYWNIGTFKDFAEEMNLVLKADYSYPIIIDEENRIVIDNVLRDLIENSNKKTMN